MPASDLLSEPAFGAALALVVRRVRRDCGRSSLGGGLIGGVRFSHRLVWDALVGTRHSCRSSSQVSRHCPSRGGLVVVEATEAEAADVVAVLRHIGSAIRLRNSSGVRVQCLDGNCRATARTGHRGQPAGLRGGVGDFTRTEPSTRSRPLLPILARVRGSHRTRAERSGRSRTARVWHHACGRVAPSTTPTSFRSNIADIRHDLPEITTRFCRCWTDRSCLVRLRVYHLAAELSDRTGHRLAARASSAFLDAYQNRSPLTIAELWVFPLMLRLVLSRAAAAAIRVG